MKSGQDKDKKEVKITEKKKENSVRKLLQAGQVKS